MLLIVNQSSHDLLYNKQQYGQMLSLLQARKLIVCLLAESWSFKLTYFAVLATSPSGSMRAASSSMMSTRPALAAVHAGRN